MYMEYLASDTIHQRSLEDINLSLGTSHLEKRILHTVAHAQLNQRYKDLSFVYCLAAIRSKWQYCNYFKTDLACSQLTELYNYYNFLFLKLKWP